MSRFLKVFLRVPLRAGIEVAGFGKHPAWDDHIDDIGLNTETLVLAKQLLYSEGIATQLASGAWDQLEKSGNAIRVRSPIRLGPGPTSDRRRNLGLRGSQRTHSVSFGDLRASRLSGSRAIDLLFDPIERLGTSAGRRKTRKTSVMHLGGLNGS